MIKKLSSAVHGRRLVYDLFVITILLGIIYVVFNDLAIVAGIGAGLVFIELVNTVKSRPNMDNTRIRSIELLVILVLSCVWVIYELTDGVDAGTALSIVFLVLTVLLLADLYRNKPTFETSKPDDDLSANEVKTQLDHCRLLFVELKKDPKTTSELATACDLTEKEVKNALNVLTDDGSVYKKDSSNGVARYHINESRFGLLGFIRVNTKRLYRYLLN